MSKVELEGTEDRIYFIDPEQVTSVTKASDGTKKCIVAYHDDVCYHITIKGHWKSVAKKIRIALAIPATEHWEAK